MAGDLTTQSDRLIEEGRSLVRDNRSGGRHRLGPPIGRGSKRLRRKNLTQRLTFMFFAFVAIFVGAGVIGMAVNGIGFVGVMLTLAMLALAVAIFSVWPKVQPPRRADLARTQDARQLVARTELWLENQRPALPPPAVKLVDDLGVQLDALGMQLEHVDPAHPAAQETRTLVGDVLPEIIDSYRKIPPHLRREERAGSTPDAQLVDGLGKIGREIDHVTRQLAEGSLDNLAIRTRYLDYKYGGEGALPAPEATPEKT